MSARYQVFHDTHYRYDSPVSLAQQLAHLWPGPVPGNCAASGNC